MFFFTFCNILFYCSSTKYPRSIEYDWISHWFASRVPRRFRGDQRDIQFKELYAALQAVLRWGDDWRHCHVIFHIDNTVIVDAIQSERNRSERTMSLLRVLLMLAACLDFSFTSSWLSSKENALADAASRFQYSRLFELAPQLERKSSSPNPRLTGLRRTLTSHDKLHSTYGTASHPALGKLTTPVSAPSLTSCVSTRPTSIPTDPSCQPPRGQSWSGWHISGAAPCSHAQLRPTCAPFVPSTSMLTYPLLSARHPSCSASSGASNVTMGSASVTPSSPLPSPFYSGSAVPCLLTNPPVMPHSQQPC